MKKKKKEVFYSNKKFFEIMTRGTRVDTTQHHFHLLFLPGQTDGVQSVY